MNMQKIDHFDLLGQFVFKNPWHILLVFLWGDVNSWKGGGGRKKTQKETLWKLKILEFHRVCYYMATLNISINDANLPNQPWSTPQPLNPSNVGLSRANKAWRSRKNASPHLASPKGAPAP